MKDISEIAELNLTLKAELIKSIQDLINLVHEVFEQQSLKEKLFRIFDTTTNKNIKKFWKNISLANSSITQDDYEIKHIKNKITKYYFVIIKKYGEIKCPICSPSQSSSEIFSQLFYLSDLVSEKNFHYKPFNELYSSLTTEKYRPSASKQQFEQ
ncbi:10885_t:CDS:2, partial [Gigaspora margarita]